MQEQELIQLLQQRDPRGIDGLLQHYGSLMRYIIAPILTDRQQQEECLSDAAMKVWEKIHLYDPQRGSWNAWLTALTRNTALNHARRHSRDTSIDALSEEQPSPEPTPEEAILQQERITELNQALGALSQAERTLFYRKYYYLQSTAQIASELGLSQRAVEGRLYRIKAHLRHMLGGDSRGKA